MTRILNMQPSFFASAPDREPIAHFIEPALAYAPPYARPVDDHLAWLLVRHLHPGSELVHGAEVKTNLGRVVLDFLVVRGRHRAAFVVVEESDVSRPAAADPLWQSLLLASGAVDSIYTITGSDLAPRLADALSVVAGWQPGLFSADGVAGLSAASSPVSASLSVTGTGSEIRLRYGAAEDQYGDEQFFWPGCDSGEITVARREVSKQAEWDERPMPVNLVA